MPSETSSGNNPPSSTQDPYKMVDPNGLETTTEGSGTAVATADSTTSVPEGSGQG